MTEIKMILNNYKIGVRSKKDLITCLQFLLESLNKYSPIGVFLENLGKSLDTIHELSDLLYNEYKETNQQKLAREISNFKGKLTATKSSLFYIKTKEKAVEMQYNLLLSFEGLGLLSGFGGATKFGDRIEYFNPERTTVV